MIFLLWEGSIHSHIDFEVSLDYLALSPGNAQYPLSRVASTTPAK